MNQGEILCANAERTHVLKFNGDVRFTICSALNRHLEKLFSEQQIEDVVIDLTDTEGIDSTSLGLLAKIANFLHEQSGGKATIFSTNEDINRILESVGFYQVFRIVEQPTKLESAPQPIREGSGSDEETSETIYQAHCILCELNSENRAMFQSVVDIMAAEREQD